MAVMDKVIEVGGGRRLEVVDAGAQDGPAIVVHHGTPGSKRLPEDWIEDAESRGLRLIAFSRAGYGASSRCEGRSVAQVVGDVTAVLDHLGVGRFATWGLSGGGPHALACAALMPARVVGVSCISGVAPYPADGLDWLAGMGDANVEEFQLAISGDSEQMLAATESSAARMRAASPEQLVQEMRSLLSPEDEGIVRGPLGAWIAACMLDGLSESAFGLFDDDMAFASPWGFDPAAISVPTQVWQGDQDLMVPLAHGEWLAGRIPGAEPHLVDGYGHLTVVARHMSEIHDWLAKRF